MATAPKPSPVKESIDTKKKILTEEIDAKKKLIASLPNWDDITTRKNAYERANHTKQLAEMEYEYELLLETERINSVVREHEELHPPITEECPICLENIPMRSAQSMVMFSCCGNGFCKKCDEEEGGRFNNKCPFCRAEIYKSDEEHINLTMRLAENGRSWAQAEIGKNYMFGVDGYPVNKKKALKWLTSAAEQKNPIAIYSLASLYKEGDGVEPSNMKAQELMTEAANLGFTAAQLDLAIWYCIGEAGLSVDNSKAVYYLTLIQERSAVADFFLGSLHYLGNSVLKESLHLAKHYLERSAKGGYEPAYDMYGNALLAPRNNQYKLCDLPGYSDTPRVLYWYRKAATSGNTKAAQQVVEIERSAKEKCSYCKKDASSMDEALKCCAKCKAAWYCGRECQVNAWKHGHKIDCIKHE